jgi:hypothetical protein
LAKALFNDRLRDEERDMQFERLFHDGFRGGQRDGLMD